MAASLSVALSVRMSVSRFEVSATLAFKIMFRLIFLAMLLTGARAGTTETQSPLRLEITWGHRSPIAKPFYVKLFGSEVTVAEAKLEQAEATDTLVDGIAQRL